MIERPLSSKAVVQTSKIQLISGAANGHEQPIASGKFESELEDVELAYSPVYVPSGCKIHLVPPT